MSDSPYVNFYTSDFLAGTSGMTAAVKGIYVTLLCLMYESEEPLPQKWGTLARRCGCTLPAFKRAIQDLVEDRKIVILENGLWSETCEKHIAYRCERRRSATSAAKKRWEKVKQKQGKGDANALSAQCQPEPEPDIRVDTDVSTVFSEAIEAYNFSAEKHGWPKVQKMSKARRSALKARMNDAGGMDGWRAALARAEASDFLCNRDGRWPGFGFDWLTKQVNFTKLMEGNYDNRPGNSRQSANPSGHRQSASIASIVARRWAESEG